MKLKKLFAIIIFIIPLFFSFTCISFNLFRPTNLKDMISNLSPEEKLNVAQEYLSSAETPEDYLNVATTLEQEFGTADEMKSDGTITATEAEAANIIGTAYLQASPAGEIIGSVLSNVGNISDTSSNDSVTNFFIAVGDTNGDGTLSSEELVDTVGNILEGFYNSAPYYDIAANYSSNTDNVDLQFTSAIANLGAAITQIFVDNNIATVTNGDVTLSDSVSETNIQNAVNDIANNNLSTTAQTYVDNAVASLNNVEDTIVDNVASNYDANNDGTADTPIYDTNGKIIGWDTNGDGTADVSATDNDGDGIPDEIQNDVTGNPIYELANSLLTALGQ